MEWNWQIQGEDGEFSFALPTGQIWFGETYAETVRKMHQAQEKWEHICKLTDRFVASFIQDEEKPKLILPGVK